MCQGQVFIKNYPDIVSTQGVQKVLKSDESSSQMFTVKHFLIFFSSSA